MEKLQLPNQVIKANWHDDIDFETYGTNEQEMEYIAPNKVSKESINRIKARKLSQERGQKLFTIFTKNEKLIA